MQEREVEKTSRAFSNIDAVFMNAPQFILNPIYDGIGLNRIPDEVLRHENQIVIGLLVSTGGYPLAYSIFCGSRYEGFTMLPVVEDFVMRFNLKDFVVVADSGLMTKKNITLLQSGRYKYILGAHVRNEAKTVREWILSQEKEEGVFHEYEKRHSIPDTDSEDSKTMRTVKERLIITYSGDSQDDTNSHNEDTT